MVCGDLGGSVLDASGDLFISSPNATTSNVSDSRNDPSYGVEIT